MGQATLHTPRLLLFPLAEEHLEFEIELDADPDVMRYLAARPSSREATGRAHHRRLALAREAPGMGVWAGRTDDGFVGWWLLRPRPHTPVDGEAELGYRLLPRFWRRGLAGEGAREMLRHGFDDLGLTRIFAETMIVNAASQATMLSIGMRYAFTFHRESGEPRPGSELGNVEYALTRDEWPGPRATG